MTFENKFCWDWEEGREAENIKTLCQTLPPAGQLPNCNLGLISQPKYNLALHIPVTQIPVKLGTQIRGLNIN
jgi:hypothetical protein